MRFQTTAAYISGAICGRMWWPQSVGGRLLKQNARGAFGFYADGNRIRDALLSLLTREGGDFQDAAFSADTVIRIERRAIDGPGRYRIHVKEIELSQIEDCADLVNQECCAGDFFGEDI